jgi:hypothetical protein
MWHHPKYYEEMKRKRKELERQASSNKHEEASKATSIKRQATSNKLLSNKRSKIHEAWALANGYKQQASSDKQQAATNCRSDDKMSH